MCVETSKMRGCNWCAIEIVWKKNSKFDNRFPLFFHSTHFVYNLTKHLNLIGISMMYWLFPFIISGVREQVVAYTEKSQVKHENRHIQLVREYGFHPRTKASVSDGKYIYDTFPFKMLTMKTCVILEIVFILNL